MKNFQSGTSKRPLARAVVATNAGVAIAALLFAAVMLVALQYVLLRSALLDDVGMQASIIGNNSAAALLFKDHEAGDETLGALQVAPYIETAAVFPLGGAPLAVYSSVPAATPARPDAALLDAGHRFSLTALEVAQRIDYRGRHLGCVLIVASLRVLYLRLLAYAALTLLVAAAALGIAMPLLSRMKRAVMRSEARLDYLAHVDPVTGLWNRNSFNERLRTALHSGAPRGGHTGLVMLDLDDFKVVNDSLGHTQGDALLHAIAQRLPAALRSGQTLYRFGGDEFAVILPALAHPADAYRAGQDILERLALPFDVGGQEVYVKASVGTSVSPADGADIETLTRSADTAMYHAKRRGKNACAAFRPEMDQRTQNRLALEHDLHQALERDEFLLYYQPQVNLRDGRIVGVEALLRWKHPQRGFVPPDEFISIAEGCGLIVPLGHWVLRSACRQAAAWRNEGLEPIQMAVNVSVRQLREKDLLASIEDALQDSGLEPSALELELTESMMLEGVEAGAALLQHLRALGVRLAIDDFGTGYSSLSYLSSYRVDKLKIDRGFVRRIPGDGATIAAAIIAMARSLDLVVIAEGVEQPAQAEFLLRAGCEMGQGYLFGAALPAEQVAALLRAQATRGRIPPALAASG
jgi:diguanylate cyclase (GGDEF)-like protein